MSQRIPSIINTEILAPDSLRLELKIDAELDFFEGHFPSTPILPGVTQVHLAEYYGRKLMPHLIPAQKYFSALETLKFQEVIRPGNTVTLCLTYMTEKQKLYFKFSSATKQYSAGRIAFNSIQT